MRQVLAWWPWLLIALPGCGGPETTAPGGTRGKLDGVVEIDGLKSTAPPEWIQEPPANQMRYAQFRLPGKDGAADASLVIFNQFHGTARENVERWKKQFSDTEGEPKITWPEVGDREAVCLDIQGTYKEEMMGGMGPHAASGPMFTNYRRIAVHMDGKHGTYHIVLTGPANTVEHFKQGFDEWLKGFK